MRHRGEQKGSVRAVCGSWYGQFNLYGKGRATRRKTVKLGRTDLMTEGEARQLLLRIIRKEMEQAGVVSHMSPSIISATVPVEFTEKSTRWSKGVAAELMVSADLVARGYLVFKPLTPLADFDLLYIEAGKPIRVEVKWVGKSNETHLRHRIAPNVGKFDVLALVQANGSIEYRPHADLAGLLSSKLRKRAELSAGAEAQVQ